MVAEIAPVATPPRYHPRMATWQSRDDDSLDEDPVYTDMDDSEDSSFDETPLPDPAGPGFIAVLGMWLILGVPLAFLAVMAAVGLARGDYDGPERVLAAGIIIAAVAIGSALWKYTQRYSAAKR
ncbi:MAG: hypothetical protein QM754_01725 [Tepidisphaeraceae bacterium]